MLLDVPDNVSHTSELFSVFVWNLDGELFLECHDEFNRIKGIYTEILNEASIRGQHFGLNAELLDNDFFNLCFNVNVVALFLIIPIEEVLCVRVPSLRRQLEPMKRLLGIRLYALALLITQCEVVLRFRVPLVCG